ncbi:hypothetical protein TrVFT333_007474 [Trichoderma virens FT-333]|nr:hypothetical protein TrVFT333_007474 [Trichoderma virens FT-333]
MRFTVVLATLVGLAVAMPKSPLYKRQCPTQPQGCCLQTGTCETCYFGDEPYPCNCECLEVGGCPCTEIDNDLHPRSVLAGWLPLEGTVKLSDDSSNSKVLERRMISMEAHNLKGLALVPTYLAGQE